ncbi:MAG TPA: protein translocase subunit SecF, partial [Gammaproteobacteria bacterium]|nr:protein translocase subunit SecF [Gammaproteobacteria bacterium]
TIVVFDRIRENFRVMRRGTAEAIINTSINQMLARTLITALTTVLVLVSLFVLGGETVSGFALALIVGIVVGTYSSIYIASALALALDVSPADLMPPKREEADSLP